LLTVPSIPSAPFHRIINTRSCIFTMAFFKNPVVVLAFMSFFGLDALAAPQVGGRPRVSQAYDDISLMTSC
jgi:hypothetical protein